MEVFVISDPKMENQLRIENSWRTSSLNRGRKSPMLTGRQIDQMVYAFFNTNDVQGRAVGLNAWRNKELRNDSLSLMKQPASNRTETSPPGRDD